MNSALFKTPQSDGGLLVIDLSTIYAIEFPDEGDCFYAFAGNKTFAIAWCERQRLMDALAAVKGGQANDHA